MSAGGVGSLDDLMGSQQQRLRNREAERLSGLEVDDEVELDRLFDRKIRRLRALENPVYVHGGSTKEIRHARPVPHESPGRHELPCTGPRPHRGPLAGFPKPYEATPVNPEEHVCKDEKRARLSSRHS